MVRKIIFLVLFTGNILSVFSQTGLKKHEILPPLKIPVKLSGTFGELRPDHFHSGIDIKTGEKTGLPVRAVEKGYISRIKISSGGYGKALYLTHPSGLTSVYAHLERFTDEVEEWVRNQQYAREQFEVDLYPPKKLFHFEQGDVIALSGNSGRSGGPHLHFEIRNARQQPMNPLAFGIDVADRRAPVIDLIKVYPESPGSLVNGQTHPAEFRTSATNNKYRINNLDTILAAGKISFGVHTVDLFNNGANKNGIYRLTFKVNGEVFWQVVIDKIDFSETRYINALIDYADRQNYRRNIYCTRIQPNNRLNLYDRRDKNGILTVRPDSVYNIIIESADIAGNVSEAAFTIFGTIPSDNSADPDTTGVLFSWKHDNTFSEKGCTLNIPGKALYDSFRFKFSVEDGDSRMFSPIYHLHDKTVPLQTWCTLSIKPSVMFSFPPEKLIIVRLEDEEPVAEPGSWENGSVTTSIRDFGSYTVLADTLAPEIVPLNISDGQSLLAQQTIRVKITDDLSGIRDYRPMLNGKWILMEYDAKNDLLIYYFDDRLKQGDNLFQLSVTDNCGNQSVYTANLSY